MTLMSGCFLLFLFIFVFTTKLFNTHYYERIKTHATVLYIVYKMNMLVRISHDTVDRVECEMSPLEMLECEMSLEKLE